MIYIKPKLLLLNMHNTFLACNSGSNADGTDCTSGSAAGSGGHCKAGSAAGGGNCETGTSVLNNCYTGTSAQTNNDPNAPQSS
jgi:hypothetical protein